ncbi:carbonic anhydrase family protein [Aspergillus aculeatinus CBS 121060]|uniref:Carbonic anhydrase n=1 Tax=Aspergillus aculeatinus CBS 121060 TaxID=1448322 RepID=A0ACD1H3F9_9EURO|nr:putative carbonic anhydrase [Aspergillus aculeatinus CBS 121060]RAH68281.1 putative carbonic anhydrase [Aspergillus aculeatinus CBS 121060]
MKHLTLLLVATTAYAFCISETFLFPRTAGDQAAINLFNYTELGGPFTWHHINKANAACSQGKHQSPIDVLSEEVDYVASSSLVLDIPAADEAKISNLGSGLEVALAQGTLSVSEDYQYQLAQFHFHTPSEHRVDQEYFPLEVHFIFKDYETNIAVVAFLFQLSSTGEAVHPFDSIFNHLDDVDRPGTYTETGYLDFKYLTAHLETHDIYRYIGSLTTPPCTEGVAWYISAEPLPLDVVSFNKIKRTLRFNARFTQNALGRENLLKVAVHAVD